MTSVIVMFALGFLNFEQATLLFGSYVTTLIVFPIVFSYVAYKKLNNNA